MNQRHLEKFRAWFDDYVAGFYGDDPYVNANLKLKEDHSRRVCDEMQYLANELSLGPNQSRIAQALALFHDIGRFEQFAKHRTYNDWVSVDHSLLGVQILQKTNVLAEIPEREKEIIEKAIEYHGLKELPGGLNGDLLLFSRLIRDADKLDIFYVVVKYYGEYKKNPENFMLQLEFPDTPQCSAEVIEAVLDGRRIGYEQLNTLNDMRLLQLGWVYDVNFTATLKRIKQREFLKTIAHSLPKTPKCENVKQTVLAYVNSKITQADN